MEYFYLQVPVLDPTTIEDLYTEVRSYYGMDSTVTPSGDPNDEAGFCLFAAAVCDYVESIFELLTGYQVEAIVSVGDNVFVTLITDRGSFCLVLDYYYEITDNNFWQITQAFWEMYLEHG